MKLASRSGAAVLALGSLLSAILAPRPVLALDPDRALTQYVHTSWLKQDGLPVNTVLDIEQTSDGYLWLATPDGLVRFDGVTFSWFHSGNTPGLDNNVLGAVLEDSRGTLWVGGNAGLFRWVGDALEEETLADGSELPGVNLLVEDSQGRLWISYHGGVARIENQIVSSYVLPDGTNSTRVTGLLVAADGSQWFAGTDLVHVVEERVHRLGAEQGLTDLPLTVFEDPQGGIWVGLREGGLARWDGSSLTRIEDTSGVSILEMQSDGEDLLLASLGRGLMRYRDGEVEFLGSREGLVSDDIHCLLQDREGNLWFGAQGGGLNRLREGVFATLSIREGLAHRNVAAVFEDTAGTLWIGTSGGGLLSRSDGIWRRWGHDQGLGSEAIMTVSQDQNGRIWVGTGNAGAYWLQEGRFRRLQSDGVDPVPVVFSLVAAPDGGFWIGGTGGAVWSDGARVEQLTEVPGERPWMTTHILADPQGAVWIGSIRSGLMRIHNGTTELFTPTEGLANDGALALHIDPNGALWIGTYGGGLQRRSDGRFATLRARDGLCEDVIYSILEDDAGALWLGGNRGVCRVDRASVEAFFAGGIEGVAARLFDADDGLTAGETSGGPNRSAYRARDGRLWFATPDGAAWVDPDRLPSPQPSPQTLIEKVVCDGRSLDLAESKPSAQLPAGTRQCSIAYTATALTRPSEVAFRYRLMGQSDEWIDAGSSRSVSFAGLTPGNYRFQVSALGQAGELGAQSEVSFQIAPLLHQTIWFRLLLLALLGALAFGVYRLRIYNLLRRQIWLERKVESRTEELEESNRTLERRVQVGIDKLRRAERFAAYGEMVASVAHEVRQPIFAMQAAGYVLSQKLAGDSEVASQLKTLDLETKRIGALMEDLLDYARPAELQRTSTDVRSMVEEAIEIHRAEWSDGGTTPVVEIPQEVGEAWLDRARIVQVLVNLLGNARKHAGESAAIQISAHRAEEDSSSGLRISVSDDGPGVEPSKLDSIFEAFVTTGQGTGLGLAIVKRIVEQHGGTVTADNLEPTGAAISMTLPMQAPTESSRPPTE